MDATPPPPAELDKTAVGVRFDEQQALESFLDSARDQEVVLLRLERQPRLFEDHEVRLTAPEDFDFRFAARPVQLFERNAGWDVVFQLVEPFTPAQERELARQLAGDGDEGEVRGTSPIFRIKNMDPNERARLALSANRTERRLLRRDGSPQVLLNLVSNPRVEAEDVLAIVKSTHVNAGLLERVAKDRRWAQNVEIRTAVVRNPKTPSPTAIRLLESLRTEDLRQMARVGALRENVRREALRVYMKRTGQR